MNWTSKEKSKYWNKSYQEYSLESGLSLKDLSNWIKVNPFVAVAIEAVSYTHLTLPTKA